MSPTTVKAPMLLTMPTELKFRIYEEVFACSDMRVRVVSLGRYMNQQILRCTNPEQYKVLRTCKQLEQEAAPILAACTTLFLGSANGNSRDSVQLLQYCNSSRAPRFLRQAVPHLSNISLYLEDGTFAKLLSCLSPFVRLRELRFSTSQIASDCVPEAIARCPLLLLGTAHDGVFVESVKRCLTSMPRYHTVFGGAEALRYTVNTPQDVLKVLTDSSTQYGVIWESEVQLTRHSSAWEPVGSTFRSPRTTLIMKFVADLKANTTLSKKFIVGNGRQWIKDPVETLLRVQNDSRRYWTQGAVAQTTLPDIFAVPQADARPRYSPSFSIDFFQLKRDEKAPAFLRQAIPSIKCIRFVSTYASRLKSDLRAFPRLQELQINGQIESYGPFNDTEVNRDPLVLLEQAHDGVFLEGMIKGLNNYTTVARGSYLDTALDNSRPYRTVWKGRVAFKIPPTRDEVGPTRITVHFEIDLARKLLLGKRFSLGEGYKIFEDPQQFFREHKEPSRDCPRLSRQEEELLSNTWRWRC